MPRLFVDTERMSNLTSGLGQVCLHLGRELVRQRPPDWEITFLIPAEQVGVFGPGGGTGGGVPGHLMFGTACTRAQRCYPCGLRHD